MTTEREIIRKTEKMIDELKSVCLWIVKCY